MSRQSRSSKKANDTCLFPFHTVVSVSTLGAANFALAPNVSVTPRGATEADSWAHFRVLKFKFRILPQGYNGSAPTNVINASAGFCGGVQDTLPGSSAQIMELLPSALLPAGQTIPSRWVAVPKEDLAGPLPWYKTVLGTADSMEEAPGQFCIFTAQAAGTGGSVFVEFYGVFQFKTAVATANTPMAILSRKALHEWRVKAADDQEREKLLKLLSPVLTQVGVSLPTPASPSGGPISRLVGL